jgi:hypothetical protein
MTKSKARRQYEEAQRHMDSDPVHREARRVHIQLFPEEYDFMMDSVADSNDRIKGVNPMSSEYVQRTNLRRQKLGFKPYEISGTNDDTFTWIYNAIKEGQTEIIRDALEVEGKYFQNPSPQ